MKNSIAEKELGNGSGWLKNTAITNLTGGENVPSSLRKNWSKNTII
jgi:hypothetical protein